MPDLSSFKYIDHLIVIAPDILVFIAQRTSKHGNQLISATELTTGGIVFDLGVKVIHVRLVELQKYAIEQC